MKIELINGPLDGFEIDSHVWRKEWVLPLPSDQVNEEVLGKPVAVKFRQVSYHYEYARGEQEDPTFLYFFKGYKS